MLRSKEIDTTQISVKIMIFTWVKKNVKRSSSKEYNHQML